MRPVNTRDSLPVVFRLAIIACSTTLPGVHGLSWPLCEDGGSVWVTKRPSTEPQYPGADLWCELYYTGFNLSSDMTIFCNSPDRVQMPPTSSRNANRILCDSGLNVLGEPLDTCINEGSICTSAVSTAICKFLGFEKADTRTAAVPASPAEHVRSLTGEYCLRRDLYSSTVPEDLESMPGEPCLKIQRIACIRSLQRMSNSLEPIIMEAVMKSVAVVRPGDAFIKSSTAAHFSANFMNSTQCYVGVEK